MDHFRILALAALVFLTASSVAAADGRTISADKILEQIAAGEPVEYDGYTIEGALDLDRLVNLPSLKEGLFYQEPHANLSGDKRAIASLMRITNCTIEGEVNFNNTIFRSPIDLKNTVFEDHAGFRGAVFKKGAYLSGSQFSEYADFLGSEIEDFAYFNDSRFHDYADFEGAYFDYANFSANFTDIADFKYAHFNDTAYFRGAGFNGDARFVGARFKGVADFQGGSFKRDSSFVGVNFSNEAKFDNVRFEENVVFGRGYDLLDQFDGGRFSYASFSYASFQRAEFNGNAGFENVSFEGADFTRAEFKGPANFKDARFTGFNIADFRGALFNSTAVFQKAIFNCTASFGNTGLNLSSASMSTGQNSEASFDNSSSIAPIPSEDMGSKRLNNNNCSESSLFIDTAVFEDPGFNSTLDLSDDILFEDESEFKIIYDFWSLILSDDNSSDGARFNEYADFQEAWFKEDAYFGDAWFNGTAEFQYARFDGAALFKEAGFNADGNFLSAEFENAEFIKGKFNGSASFLFARLNGTADFKSAEFNSPADFSGAGFKSDAYFANTTFNITYFTEAQFDKEAQFEDANFTGKTTFENARFKEDALFENATFEDELTLTNARYSKLFLRWSSIKGGLAYDDSAYMSLMKNFKDIGYYEDYDSCYYAYRKAHRGVDWPSVPDWEEAIRKFIDYPLQWFYGYGTKPFHAFFWSLGIVVAFFFYWRWLGLGGPRDKTKEGLKDGVEWLDGDLTDILGYSVTVFLSGTKFFIDPPPLPKIEGRSRPWMKKAFILERVLGALFSVLFFIAISGTIVRAS